MSLANASFHVPSSFLVALAIGAPATAQVRPVAFPHGAASGTNGNWIPLGEMCTGGVAEGRTQVLIPARYLPTRPTVANALEHIPVWLTSPQAPNCPQGMYTVQYSLLEVTLAHRAPGSGPLSLTFANNLPSPPPPPVFPAQSITISWTVNDWNGIAFAQPFAYNGVDDIVVEIRKVVIPTGQNVGTLRNLNSTRIDLPRQVQVGGPVGSGASSAPTGTYNNLLGWRLRFDADPAPTLEVRSPLGPSSLHYTNGTTPHFRIFAPAGDVFVLAASFAFFPASVPIPPFGGKLWLLPPIEVLTANIVAPQPGTVYHRHDFPLPPGPALVGMLIGAQVATFGIWTGQWELTNAVDFVIM